MAKATKNPKLEKTKDLIEKFKSKLEKDVGVKVNADLEKIPTGIEFLDLFSGGGYPAGGFIMKVGNPGANKTLLAIETVAGLMRQNPESLCIYIDTETSLTLERLESLGVDTSRTLLIRNMTLEKLDEALENFYKLKKELKLEDVPSFIVWDSIATTPSEKQMAGDSIESTNYIKSKFLSSKLPTWCTKLENNKTAMIAINQLRLEVKQNPYDKANKIKIRGLEGYELPGGTAQYFQASLFLKLEFVEEFTSSDAVSIGKKDAVVDKIDDLTEGFAGQLIRGTFLKNKYARPYVPFYLVIDTNTGINHFWTKFYYLQKAGFIESVGGYMQMKDYSKKFRRKTADKEYENKEFKEIFDKHWNVVKEKIIKLLKKQG